MRAVRHGLEEARVLAQDRAQDRGEAQARQMRADAIALEQAGAAMILLECVPSELAAEITQAVKVPVIGVVAEPTWMSPPLRLARKRPLQSLLTSGAMAEPLPV